MEISKFHIKIVEKCARVDLEIFKTRVYVYKMHLLLYPYIPILKFNI